MSVLSGCDANDETIITLSLFGAATMIETLQVITILTTALFGIFASFAQFRDDTGRITRHGWIGLTGVILTGSLAAGLQLYSDRRQERDTAQVLREIRRSLEPLHGMSLSYSIEPDWSLPEYRAYMGEFVRQHSLTGTSVGFARLPKKVHPLLRRTLCQVGVEIFFFRTPTNAMNFSPSVRHSGEDLRITSRSPCEYEGLTIGEGGGSMRFYFILIEGVLKKLALQIERFVPDPQSSYWRSTGTVVSLQDLLGGQIIIHLSDLGKLYDKETRRLLEATQLTELNLHLPSGLVLHFDRDNLVMHRGPGNLRGYSIVIPETMDELRSIARYDQFKWSDKYFKD